jgi:hypothetical protein
LNTVPQVISDYIVLAVTLDSIIGSDTIVASVLPWLSCSRHDPWFWRKERPWNFSVLQRVYLYSLVSYCWESHENGRCCWQSHLPADTLYYHNFTYSPHFRRNSLRGGGVSALVRFRGKVNWWWTKVLLLVENSMTHQVVTILRTE